ncbi:MAG TPA: MASE1 domain-containing protein [Candidatus Acidoferrales bacterium]|nr:MASE1 domain-containing protein [Candidatus Acidoferrales bacterium]
MSRTAPGLARHLLTLSLVATAYWLAARLSLNLALVHGQVTPIWPPTGIALVAVLVIGRRVWPAITIGALAVNLPIGPTPAAALVIAAGNTLAPMVSAELLRRADFRFELARFRDAIALVVLGALTGMAISATLGSGVLVLSGAIPPSFFWATWAVWWTGDAMGVLLVAPFLLSLLARPRWRSLTWWRSAELAGLLAGTAIVTYLVFQSALRLEYLAFPFILMAAWRFRLQGAAPAALIASGVAVWAASKGIGAFAGESLFQRMLSLQAFNVTLALASFVLAIFVEARERKEEMSRLYAAERLAGEAKSSFLNLAAHELRTPLTVLSGYLSMLYDGSLGSAPRGWHEPLEILLAQAAELNKIVDDLLEASRIEANAIPPKRAQVDLRGVIREAVRRAGPRADLLRAKIVTRVGPRPILLEADADQLGRILDNLIANGLVYSVRRPRLSISATAEPRQATVRVGDNGVGIAESDRERVFERFQRGGDPRFHKVPGTGLGLYIGRRLAEEHGGGLVIESSRPDQGTVFALTLPIAPQPRSNGGGRVRILESAPA